MNQFEYYSDEDEEEESEESDDLEDVDNGGAVFVGREQTKDLNGVAEVMHQEASSFAALSCLSEAAAIVLLRHFGWNQQTAQEEYFLNPSELLTAVKLNEEIAMRESKISYSETECMICGDTDENGKTMGLAGCEHFFCSQCWQDDIRYKMEKGEELFDVRCMMDKCNELMSVNCLITLCGYTSVSDHAHGIQRYVATQYANQSSHFSRCINSPNCLGFVYLPIKHQPAPTVHCGFCNAEFCFICRRTRHAPASCTEVQRWEDQMDHDSASTSCVISTTKGCPKCHRRIEKNKGCLHMTCRNPCLYEFCWNCLGPWENHDNFRCTNPEDKYADKAVVSEIQKDFLTLFLGYNQNQLKLREEILRIDQICLRISDFIVKLNSRGAFMTPYAVEHLLQSVKTSIQRARTTLMYSYVKQWFRRDEREKNILSHRMTSLESVTIKLSSIVLSDTDANISSAFSKDTENAINAVNAWISTILDDSFGD